LMCGRTGGLGRVAGFSNRLENIPNSAAHLLLLGSCQRGHGACDSHVKQRKGSFEEES
jgi:hypothetical protein